MDIYILIHGAWHGNWCWYKIIPLLEALGNKVIAPDLPGHFSNKEKFKNINLKTYVDYIESLINSVPGKIILVGHSMAGIIITQIAENMPERIKKLIYITSFIPESGYSLIEEEKRSLLPSISLETRIDKLNNALLLTHNSHVKIRKLLYNQSKDEDVKYALSNLQPQPLQPFLDIISFSESNFGRVPKIYVECLQDNAISIYDQRRMHSKMTNCDIISIDTDHSPFFSSPGLLTKSININ